MNSFCKECTNNDKKEIRECDDKKCPFWTERFADLQWQIERRKNERK